MNNKKLSTILLLFFSVIAFAENLSIASWNICHNDSDELIEIISNVIKTKNIDILSLQEVNLDFKSKAPNFLDRLIIHLNNQDIGSWAYFSTKEYAIRKNYNNFEYKYCSKGQDNAVIYCTNKLIGVDYYKKFGLDSFIESKYKTDKNNFQIIFFRSKNTAIEDEKGKFFYINLHLPYNDKEHRYRDLNTISDLFVYGLPYDSNKILTGDFNMPQEALGAKLHEYGYKDLYIGISKKTTLSNIRKKKFANSYDHFVYNKQIQQYNTSNSKRLANIHNEQIVLGKSIIIDFKWYREKISDHIPIVIQFNFNK